MRAEDFQIQLVRSETDCWMCGVYFKIPELEFVADWLHDARQTP